jgi:hypothetical protein
MKIAEAAIVQGEFPAAESCGPLGAVRCHRQAESSGEFENVITPDDVHDNRFSCETAGISRRSLISPPDPSKQRDTLTLSEQHWIFALAELRGLATSLSDRKSTETDRLFFRFATRSRSNSIVSVAFFSSAVISSGFENGGESSILAR